MAWTQSGLVITGSFSASSIQHSLRDYDFNRDKEKVCSASRPIYSFGMCWIFKFLWVVFLVCFLFLLSFVKILKFQGEVWELIFNGVTLMEIFDDFISDKLHFWPKLSALHNSISFYQSDKHCIVTSDTFHTTKHTCPVF